MQGKSHIYFLVDEMNRSLYVEGDVVKVSGIPRPLAFSPDGWTKIEIDNQRNTKYFALDRSFTIPLDFVEDGALILKDAYYKKGVEAKIYLVILKQKLQLTKDGAGNITGFGYYYDSFYRGEIDFSQFQHAGPKATVNIMEGGIPKYIKANENTKYELDVDVPEARYVLMDGINLKQSSKFLVIDPSADNFNGNHSVPLTLIGQENIDINTKAVDRVQLGGNNGSDQNNKLVHDELWFYKASTNIPVTVKWDFKMMAQLA